MGSDLQELEHTELWRSQLDSRSGEIDVDTINTYTMCKVVRPAPLVKSSFWQRVQNMVHKAYFLISRKIRFLMSKFHQTSIQPDRTLQSACRGRRTASPPPAVGQQFDQQSIRKKSTFPVPNVWHASSRLIKLAKLGEPIGCNVRSEFSGGGGVVESLADPSRLIR